MTPSGGYQGVTSFGQDGLGGLYILDYVAGSIYRVVSASSDAPEVPGRRDLAQNFPNPFNPRTEIAFTVDTSATPTTLRIYDAAGRRVRTLVSRVLEAGDHVVSWNGTDDHGGRLPSGMYIYRMESGGTQLSRKMVMLE